MKMTREIKQTISLAMQEKHQEWPYYAVSRTGQITARRFVKGSRNKRREYLDCGTVAELLKPKA